MQSLLLHYDYNDLMLYFFFHAIVYAVQLLVQYMFDY